MIKNITRSLRGYFKVSGRATADEFWAFTGFRFLVLCLALYILGDVIWEFAISSEVPTSDDLRAYAMDKRWSIRFSTGLFLAFVIPGYTVFARRLHDRGLPAWPLWTTFLLAFSQIHIIAILIFFGSFAPAWTAEKFLSYQLAIAKIMLSKLESGYIGTGFPIFAIAILLVVFVGSMFFLFAIYQTYRPSQPGSNKYGPNPSEDTP